MNEQAMQTLENELRRIYLSAGQNVDKAINSAIKTASEPENLETVILQLRRQSGLITNEITHAGSLASNAIDSNNIKLYRYSYLDALQTINNQIDYNVYWDLPDAAEFDTLFNSSKNIYDFRAHSNLQNTQIMNNRFNNALVAVGLSGVAIYAINKLIKDKTVTRAWNDSMRLARTQSVSCLNGARFQAFRQADRMRIRGGKKWVSTYDGRTRKTHKDLQGNIVGLYEEFDNGLMYPRDPNGDANETINCRCTISYVLDESQEYDYSGSFGESDYDLEEMLEEIEW